MATKIEWVRNLDGTQGETWNPVTGCTKVSEGCRNCYAERMSKRLAGRFGYPSAPNNFDVCFHLDRLTAPLKWRKSRMVFVCSMGDLFHPDVPDWALRSIFHVIVRAQPGGHIFQILTKRAWRMQRWMSKNYPKPLSNVWLGVSAEDQDYYDGRVSLLLCTPATVRFVSLEPLLGPIHLPPWLSGSEFKLDWVIAGGESGPGARPPDPDWFRSIRDQCVAAKVPFFFKQWGGPQKKGWVSEDGTMYEGRILDGEIWDQYPGEVKK